MDQETSVKTPDSLNVLHLTPAYKPAYIYGGPTMSVAKLCEVLVHAGANIEILTTTANGSKELEIETGKRQLVDGVPVTYFKRWTKDHSHFSPGLLLALRSLTKQYPLIHIHSWWNLVSVLSCWLAQIRGVEIVLSPRGMLTGYTLNNKHSLLKRTFHKYVGQRLLRSCHIHATSEQEKADILAHITPKSVTVIPNLVELDSKISIGQTNRADNPFKLLFLSRIEQKKGLEFLFAVLEQLQFPWELTIAGSGEPTYLQGLKTLTEGQKNIHWIGHVVNDDKYDILASHHLLILPSYNENFANVIIESLSVGTPVFVSDRVGLSDYVLQQDLGWVAPLDHAQFTQQLLSAYTAVHKRNIIREQAPNAIARDFNDNALVQSYLQMYRKILNSKELPDLA